MARPKKDIVYHTVSLPRNISETLEKKFFDQKTGKRGHGALSNYLTKLVIRDLRESKVAEKSIIDLIEESNNG